MPLTVASLDTVSCARCGELLRAHCTETDGAWFVRPCDAMLKVIAPRWKRMVADDGVACRHCGKPIRSHFVTDRRTVSIVMGNATAEIGTPSVKPGDIVLPPDPVFVDCREVT